MGWLTAISLAGLAVNAYGQYRAGKEAKKGTDAAAREQERAGRAGKKVADANANLADFNAQVADLQATDSIDRGADAESRFRTQIKGAIGAQRAGFAGGNIDVSFGSAVDVQADAAFLGEMDALQLRTNAAREAWGFKVQAEDYRRRGAIMRKEGVNIEEAGRFNAAATRQSGRAAEQTGYLNASSSIIGGTASLLQMRYGMRK